jgi:hypothetical protein
VAPEYQVAALAAWGHARMRLIVAAAPTEWPNKPIWMTEFGIDSGTFKASPFLAAHNHGGVKAMHVLGRVLGAIETEGLVEVLQYYRSHPPCHAPYTVHRLVQCIGARSCHVRSSTHHPALLVVLGTLQPWWPGLGEGCGDAAVGHGWQWDAGRGRGCADVCTRLGSGNAARRVDDARRDVRSGRCEDVVGECDGTPRYGRNDVPAGRRV